MRSMTAVVLCLALVSTALAWADKSSRDEKRTTITVTYGVVLEVSDVDIKSEAGKGAIFGGLIGLAVGHDKSTKNQVASGAAGAALGAIISRAAEGKHKAQGYTVRRADGSTIKIIMDHADAAAGDCVAVEEGKTSNLRRVSTQMCDTPALQSDLQVRESHDDDADACQKAKEALLAAETAEAVELATSKMKALCH